MVGAVMDDMEDIDLQSLALPAPALGNNGKIHGEVDEDHFFGIYMGKSTISYYFNGHG